MLALQRMGEAGGQLFEAVAGARRVRSGIGQSLPQGDEPGSAARSAGDRPPQPVACRGGPAFRAGAAAVRRVGQSACQPVQLLRIAALITCADCRRSVLPSSASVRSRRVRSGAATSAAAVGVGARRSAAKSAMVKSVSWPTPLMTGIGQAREGAGHDLFVERPQIFDAAAAAADDQRLAEAARARSGNRGSNLRSGAVLYRRREEHDGRRPSRQGTENVARPLPAAR